MDEPQQPAPKKDASKYLVPISILVAGVIIAGAVFFGNRSNSTAKTTTTGPAKAEEIAITPLGTDEHILGSPSAAITMVEYSDEECPYCKQFQVTMNQLMDGEYGKSGKLAWVYRNFPLTQIHPDADRRANAVECVASLGGNQKFWDFTNKIFTSPDFDNLKIDLAAIAQSIGISKTDFNSCLDAKKFEKKIQDQATNGVASGGQGTPHNVLVLKNKMSASAKAYMDGLITQYQSADVFAYSPDQMRIRIGGAIPYDMMKGILDALLK